MSLRLWKIRKLLFNALNKVMNAIAIIKYLNFQILFLGSTVQNMLTFSTHNY